MSQATRHLSPGPPESGSAGGRVLDAEAMSRAWKRVAHEIVERNGEASLVLAGIPTRGVPLARRLQALLQSLGADAELVELAVEEHRDDRPPNGTAPAPDDSPATPPMADVAGRVVVIVDDVIFHGRTARAALDALTERGRASAVQLAVMVDRGHRELPIRADYVGKNIPTHARDRVRVHLEEIDGLDDVVVEEANRERA